MARVGEFTGPTVPFGVPTSTIHPVDNNIFPDPTLAERDRIESETQALLEDIKNQQRKDRPGK
jgi:hypothetical protein